MTVYKKIVIGIALLIVVSAGLFRRELLWTARYAFSAGGTSASEAAPVVPACPGCHLILVSLDTLRADHMGFQGSSAGLTPNFDRIAGQSLVFSHAFANAFYTTPSHMTVFTSLYPQQHHVEGDEIKVPRMPRGGRASPVSAGVEMLAEKLKSAGFATTWAGPLALKHLDPALGFQRGFDLKVPPIFTRRVEEILDPDLAFDAGPVWQRLGSGGGGRQFVFLHSFVTHMPFVSESEDAPRSLRADFLLNGLSREIAGRPSHYDLTSDSDIKTCSDPATARACWRKIMDRSRYFHAMGQWQLLQWTGRGLSDEKIAHFRQAYADQVRHLDGQIGQLWKGLEAGGHLQNSIVVFFSDHGEELFEHGKPSHSSFFDHTIRIPLVIYHPGLKAGAKVHHMVSLVDLMPTLLSWLDLPPSPQTQGRHLLEEGQDLVLGYSLGNSFVRNRDWKLIRWYDGRENLFYLPLDPSEEDDLMDLRNPWAKTAYRKLSQSLSDLETRPAP